MTKPDEPARRMRAALDGLDNVEVKKMMGGLCFMVNGHMLGGTRTHADGIARYMFRVGNERESEALARPGAYRVVMGKRQMTGFVHVPADDMSDDALADWISLAMDYIRTLPPKTARGG